MGIISGILISLLKSYVAKLATEEVGHYILMEIGDAMVKSTKTKWDDKQFAKFKEFVDVK